MNQALMVSQVLLWIGLLGLVLVMAAILRQLGVLFERVAPAGALAMNSRLAAGDRAPKFSLDSLNGNQVQIGGQTLRRKNTLLFFLSTDCPVCRELLPALTSFLNHERRTTDIVFVGSAQESDHKKNAIDKGLPLDSYVVSDAVGMAYAVSKLPYAVLIDDDGAVSSFGIVNNREHLESLLEARHEGVASIQEYMKRTA